MISVTIVPKRLSGVLCAAALSAVSASAGAMSLSEALDRTIQHDPAVRASIAQHDADQEAGAEDRASRLPSVNVTGYGQFGRTKSQGVFGSLAESYPAWGAQLEARQPLFRLDWWARGDRAEAVEQRADEALRERRNALLLRVAERYFDVLDARDVVAQQRQEAEAVAESFEDAKNRFEVQLIPKTDLVEAQSRHDLAQAQLLTAQRALENAEDALAEITGMYPEQLPVLSPEVALPAVEPATLAPWIQAAEARNPALMQAKADWKVAEANARSAEAARVPEVDLVGRVGVDDSSEYQFGQRLEDRVIGVEVTLPLYNGGALAARERQTAAQVRVARAEFERIQAESRRLVRERFRAVDSARREARAFTQALASAKAAREATENGYDAGTRTITDVLDATSRVAQAQRDLNATRYRLLLNILRLKETVGEMDAGDFAALDALLRYDDTAGTDAAGTTETIKEVQ
ncbi:MAG: TolC family outer membrane protein [Algiphilus sp.]